MSARVIDYKGRTFDVRNLRWLRDHTAEVEFFDLAEGPRGGRGFMVAHLKGGGVYLCQFESFAIMLDWVAGGRGRFVGVPAFRCLLEVIAEPDDTEVRGNALASGNDAEDKAAEDAILDRLNRGDVWAWAFVRVRVTHGDIITEEALGACNYESERDFTSRLDDYFADMAQNAIDECRSKYIATLGSLDIIKKANRVGVIR